mmetsp:Transcript_6011/g.14606  ORF Transcript_6011/g.14606 Transcript_6011/m.14606 type:complete len:154 (+) Transcript_6011:111-572(+)
MKSKVHTFLLGVSALLVNHEFGFRVQGTYGSSMSPTISSTGEVLLVEVLSKRNRSGWVRNGDVIVLKAPYDSELSVCKRVTGMEGEYVEDSSGALLKVPMGKVWVEGDNRASSRDSRQYGPVPIGLVEGRVILRIFPPSKGLTLSNPRSERQD